MSLTFLEKLEARGEARGEAKGKRELGQDMVLAVLQDKFIKIPAKIETAIRDISDPIALKSLCVHASTCRTLKEFAEDLE
ncbi:MAG: hypothetical protein LBC02_05220 [Planctomycetaceae bacterium]|jgi:hypothetical protein|nr:hypothetical protein [Planctomycetaceae bacterium]